MIKICDIVQHISQKVFGQFSWNFHDRSHRA